MQVKAVVVLHITHRHAHATFKSFGKDMLHIFSEMVCNKFKAFSGLNIIY